MPKKTEREVAVAVLSDVLGGGAFANIALRKALADAESFEMDARGRAFVTDLVNETLRNLILIDHIINDVSNTPVDKMKPFIRNLLRISVCQIRHMDRIPDRAAVNEAVNLTKARGMTNLSGFVNGVLRAVTRKAAVAHANAALQYSYPKWLYTSLVRWLGEDGALEFCKNSHQIPAVVVRVNTCKTDVAQLQETLENEGVVSALFSGDENFLILRQTGDISKLKSFQDGLFFVMDPGAMLAVEAMSLKPGQSIIDLCAAPGGKSFAAACLMQNAGRIRAFDIHQHRIELIRQTRKRLDLHIVSTDLKDALVRDPALNQSADAVLLDAPCSGLGTIRKHPEIKFTRNPQDITDLVEKQRQMLKTAAEYVKIGGILVYCTCTVAVEENMDSIHDFLQSHVNYTLEFARQTLPSSTSDGFFVAKMLRRS